LAPKPGKYGTSRRDLGEKEDKAGLIRPLQGGRTSIMTMENGSDTKRKKSQRIRRMEVAHRSRCSVRRPSQQVSEKGSEKGGRDLTKAGFTPQGSSKRRVTTWGDGRYFRLNERRRENEKRRKLSKSRRRFSSRKLKAMDRGNVEADGGQILMERCRLPDNQGSSSLD